MSRRRKGVCSDESTAAHGMMQKKRRKRVASLRAVTACGRKTFTLFFCEFFLSLSHFSISKLDLFELLFYFVPW